MLLELDHIDKSYVQGKTEVPVLKDVSLKVDQGEYVAVMGPSGSGKTTLMNIIGCLDRPDSGKIQFGGRDLLRCRDRELSEIRLYNIGFVFQNYFLMPRETALENVMLPLTYAGIAKRDRRRLAAEALERVGLSDRMIYRQNQLSGGKCQRVAIARAIAVKPKMLLADEPTGALDSQSGTQIMELFRSLNEDGVTIIMITHDAEIAARAKRMIRIKDGKIREEEAAIGRK